MAMPAEPSRYCRSRGADPIATIGALTLGLATVAAFALMSPQFVQKEKREATVVQLMALPDDPPPAAEAPPPPSTPDAPPPSSQISAPVPVVALAAPPAMVAPQPAPQPAPPTAKAEPAAPAPVVAKGPENAGDLSAQVVYRRPIRVPLESRRAHEEGVVVLALLLGMDGRIVEISVATSSGFPRLDRAALESVRNWRWSPLLRNGNPVMVRGLVRIPFIRERGGRDGDGARDHHGRSRGDRAGDGPRGDDALAGSERT